MSDLFNLESVRRVLATERQLRDVRAEMHSIFPVGTEGDLSALRCRLEEDSADPEMARLHALGEQLVTLDRVVLEESLLALADIGFESASIAVAHILGELGDGTSSSAL